MYLANYLCLIILFNKINTLFGGNGSGSANVYGNLPVNWPKLLRPFLNVVTTFFDVYMFGMSFFNTSSTKKSDIIL